MYGVRLCLGQLHSQAHIGSYCPAGALALDERSHGGRFAEAVLAEGGRLQAAPFAGAAVAAFHIGPTTDNGHFFRCYLLYSSAVQTRFYPFHRHPINPRPA